MGIWKQADLRVFKQVVVELTDNVSGTSKGSPQGDARIVSSPCIVWSSRERETEELYAS